MAVHIGKLIEKKIKEIGMSKSELGRRVSISPQTTHYILKNNSIDTDLLRKISLALSYDFFQHYLGLKSPDKSAKSLINNSSSELKQKLIEVNKEIDILLLHNGYLREIVSLIEQQINSLPKKTGQRIKYLRD